MESSSNTVILTPPKKPLTSFFLYKQDEMESCKLDNPGISATKLCKILADTWKTSPRLQKKYEIRAQRELEKYYKELEEYEEKISKSARSETSKESPAKSVPFIEEEEPEKKPSVKMIKISTSKSEIDTQVDLSTMKRIISIYFDTMHQQIALYPGTTAEDIVKTIKMIFKFDQTQELLFLDEDGIPVVLSAAIPSGTKLYMQKYESKTEQIINKMQEEKKAEEIKIEEDNTKWEWLAPGNTSHMRKNNNLTVYQPVNNSMSYCYGSLVFEKGKVYYTLLFDPMYCCVYAGIEQPGKDFSHQSSEYLREIDLHNLFQEERSKLNPSVEIGFLIDMDSKKLVITNHDAKVIKKTIAINQAWEKVSPLVYFKHVVSITISNPSMTIPEWIKY